MDKTSNHLELTIGTELTIYFEDQSTLTAEAFRTNDAGVYVSAIKKIDGPLATTLLMEDLCFFPYQKIAFLKYVITSVKKVADTPVPASTPKG